MVIKVFIASSSGQLSIKKQQQDLLGLLNVLHIDFEQHDIAVNEDDRRYMREHVPPDHRPPSGNPLPPQVFNGEKYCGDYESFFDAKETNSVYTFLGLIPPPGSKEAAVLAEQRS